MTVNLVAQFNEFLREQAKGGGTVDTLQKLKAEAGISLVLTNLDDPDGRHKNIWKCTFDRCIRHSL